MCNRQEVRWSIQENESRIKTGKESVRNPLSSMTAKTNQPFKITVILGRKVDGTFVLWLALFCGIFASVPLFVQGHALSPHEKGTTNDADFWFLKQASIMQLLGSIVSALLESRNGELPRWRWVLPSIIAAACSVTASPLYLLVPTEWSAFLSLIAGDTQSFMVLQHFLSSTKNSVVPDS